MPGWPRGRECGASPHGTTCGQPGRQVADEYGAAEGRALRADWELPERRL